MPPDVTKWSAIIAIVGLVVSVGSSLAVSNYRVSLTEERLEDHEDRMRSVEYTLASELSRMNGNIEWLVAEATRDNERELDRTMSMRNGIKMEDR